MTLVSYLLFNFILFNIGLFGILLNKKNLIIILISLEILLMSINLNFIFFSIYLDDILGEIFSLLILTVAAAESAIGLSIIVVYFRLKGSIKMNSLNLKSI